MPCAECRTLQAPCPDTPPQPHTVPPCLPRSGCWAACCDSLGRVLLVDTASTLVLRMLKGYRDAQVAWLVCPEGGAGSGGGAGGGGASAWAARRLAAGSSSSLGGGSSSVGGSLSVRSSAADLAATHWQQDWDGWGEGEAVAGQPEPQPDQQLQQQQQQEQQQGSDPKGSPAPVAHAAAPSLEQQGPPVAGPSPPGAQQGGAAGGQRGVPPHTPLLVIYAPRRAVVELWEPHSLARLGSVACSTQLGLLLAQPVRRRHSGAGGGAGGHVAANRCMLLDASTLVLADLTDILLSSLV